MGVDPRIRRWLANQGVQLDENGLPIHVAIPGPAQNCFRCNGLTEMPPKACGIICGQAFDDIPICYDCRLLQFTNPTQFWQQGWQGLRSNN